MLGLLLEQPTVAGKPLQRELTGYRRRVEARTGSCIASMTTDTRSSSSGSATAATSTEVGSHLLQIAGSGVTRRALQTLLTLR
jgi:hypothetical protein